MKQVEVPRFVPDVHVFVCCNDRRATNPSKPSCGVHMTKDQVKELKLWIRQQGWVGEVAATSCSCLGLCHPEGGVVRIFPSGRMFQNVTSIDEIKNLIENELRPPPS